MSNLPFLPESLTIAGKSVRYTASYEFEAGVDHDRGAEMCSGSGMAVMRYTGERTYNLTLNIYDFAGMIPEYIGAEIDKLLNPYGLYVIERVLTSPVLVLHYYRHQLRMR